MNTQKGACYPHWWTIITMRFARGRRLRRLGNCPHMKIVILRLIILSNLECDLRQRLIISRVECKECLL